MTWKSTAVVSGLGLLATWLASGPQYSTPPGAAPNAAATAQRAAAHPDIEEQAERLGAALRPQASYDEPSRNPFRFSAPVTRAPVVTPPAVTEEPPPVPPPAALRITLSGIATDTVDGREQRTAILSAPSGVLLVREGDEVAGQYRVGAVDAEGIELIRLDDGGILRLTLSHPKSQ
jgi:hypothetical protein